MSDNSARIVPVVAFEGEVTGVTAARIVNAVLESLESPLRVKPQMMYNYMNKGYIGTTQKNRTNAAKLNTWLEGYVTRNVFGEGASRGTVEFTISTPVPQDTTAE